MVFIKFQNFEKFCLILAVFWPKNRIFFNFREYVLKKKFWRKIYLVLDLGKWSNWPKAWYTCTLVHLLDLHRGDFGFFVFLPFYGARNAQNGLFLVNFGDFWQKIARFAHFGPHKMAKTQKIQNPLCVSLVNVLGYMYTKL